MEGQEGYGLLVSGGVESESGGRATEEGWHGKRYGLDEQARWDSDSCLTPCATDRVRIAALRGNERSRRYSLPLRRSSQLAEPGPAGGSRGLKGEGMRPAANNKRDNVPPKNQKDLGGPARMSIVASLLKVNLYI